MNLWGPHDSTSAVLGSQVHTTVLGFVALGSQPQAAS